MKSFSPVVCCFLLTGLFGLTACVFAGPDHDAHGPPQAQMNGNHDDGGHCNSPHDGDHCQDVEHH